MFEEYLVDIEGFHHWLKAFGPDDFVGWTRIPGACPLKNYLASKDTAISGVLPNFLEKEVDIRLYDFSLKVLVDTKGLKEGISILINSIDTLFGDKCVQITSFEVLALIERAYGGGES